MSDTYKVGRGKGTRTVTARQYTRDQDFSLAKWAGRVQVHRDHFRLLDGQGNQVGTAAKGDWLVKDDQGSLVKVDGSTFASTYRGVEE